MVCSNSIANPTTGLTDHGLLRLEESVYQMVTYRAASMYWRLLIAVMHPASAFTCEVRQYRRHARFELAGPLTKENILQPNNWSSPLINLQTSSTKAPLPSAAFLPIGPNHVASLPDSSIEKIQQQDSPAIRLHDLLPHSRPCSTNSIW